MGIQEHFIRALGAVVERFKEEPAVVGFEILNEPPPSTLSLFHFASRDLYPFYRRVIQGVTGLRDGLPDCPPDAPVGNACAFPDLGIGDTRHVFFFEPSALRNELDVDLQFSKPFTEYPNIAYAPHDYSYSFTRTLPGGHEAI